MGTLIGIHLEDSFGPDATQVESSRSLRNLLEYMVRENMDKRRSHPEFSSLYRSGVIYARTTWWEPIPALYKRGRGDCKSLATALVAEYRLAGVWAMPVHRWVRNPKDGETDYHILVQTESGWEDPSRVLGMGYHENARFYGDESDGDSRYLRNHRHRHLGGRLV